MHIAVYAFDGITMFHLSIPQMVFRTVEQLGLADWRVSLFTLDSGQTAPADEAGLSQWDRPQAQADNAGAPCMRSFQ